MQSNLIVRAAVIGLLAAFATGQQRQPADVGTVSFDAKKSTLAVKAGKLAVSEVLARLQQEHGIRVTVVDFQDRKVEADVQALPLEQALAALLGKDVRYQLDFGKDVELPAPAPGLQTPKPGVVTANDLPEMPSKPIARAGVPAMGEGPLPVGPRMGDATVIRGQVVEGDLADEVAQDLTVPTSHAVLMLRLRKGAAPVVESVVEQDGALVTPERLAGDWIWELAVAGRTVAVGSLPDPHQAFPICEGKPLDPRRKQLRTEDQDVGISIAVGKELLDPAVRGQAVLRLRKLTDAKDLPTGFGIDTFAAFAGKSTEVATLGAQALVAARTIRK